MYHTIYVFILVIQCSVVVMSSVNKRAWSLLWPLEDPLLQQDWRIALGYTSAIWG